MQSLKVSGRRTLAAVRAEVNETMRNFTGKTYATSEQHISATTERTQKDAINTETLQSFLSIRNPFEGGSSLRNIVTGVEDNTSNADSAKEIGDEILSDISGKNVHLTGHMVFHGSKDDFLANSINKSRFIELLSFHL